MRIMVWTAVILVSFLTSSFFIGCGPDSESIRATQVAFMQERQITATAHAVKAATVTANNNRARIAAIATAKAEHTSPPTATPHPDGCDPRIYKCRVVRFNEIVSELRRYGGSFNHLIDRVNNLYNARFERPRGAIVLKGAYVEGLDLDWSDPEKASAEIEKHIGEQQTAEGRKVWEWMHKVVSTCHEVRRHQDKILAFEKRLSDNWFASENYEKATRFINSAQSKLYRIELDCTPGTPLAFDHRFEELAELHGIQNPPNNW